MSHRKKVLAGAAVIALAAFAGVAALQARTAGRKADGIRTGMSFAEVSRQLDGWALINAHPEGRGTQNRAKPGPEYFGYSGQVYVLTPVEPGAGEPWTVYFNFRTIGPDTGVFVRFDGSGRQPGIDSSESR